MRKHETKLDIKTWKFSQVTPEEDHFVRRGQACQWRDVLDANMMGAYQACFAKSLAGAAWARGYNSPAAAVATAATA
jgi:hypothetical protein